MQEIKGILFEALVNNMGRFPYIFQIYIPMLTGFWN